MSVISNEDAATINSSIKSENFKEIWKIIDEHEKDPISSAIQVTSLKPGMPKKEATKSPAKKSGSISARNNSDSKNIKFKIRNYNDKS